MIHDVPTCKVLIERIEREAIETMQQTSALIVEDESQIPHTGTDEVSSHPAKDAKGADADLAEKGGKGEEKKTRDGTVGAKDNHPEAQLWGIGEKKQSKL